MEKEKLIDIAVNWWADKLKKPHHDNGDNSQAGIMAMIMADMASSKISDEQIEVFKKELKTRIEEQYQDIEEIRDIWLGCDYAPMKILSVPAEIAGINLMNFPFKTDMRITKGCVEVSDGYAQPFVKLGVGDI